MVSSVAQSLETSLRHQYLVKHCPSWQVVPVFWGSPDNPVEYLLHLRHLTVTYQDYGLVGCDILPRLPSLQEPLYKAITV